MIIILIIELLVLLFLRKKLASLLMFTVAVFGGTPNMAIWLYSLLSLPGVLSHEMSHFLTAAFVGLRTGAIEMLPTLSNEGGVELGSVQVNKSDPFRSSLVGIAPLFSGLILIAWLSSRLTFPQISDWYQLFSFEWHWTTIAMIYLIMTIALHLFPSKQDMDAWPVAFVLLFLFAAAGWQLGMNFSFLEPVGEKVSFIVNQMIFGLFWAIIFTFIFGFVNWIGLYGLLALMRMGKRRKY